MNKGTTGKHWKLSEETKHKMVVSAKKRPKRTESHSKNIGIAKKGSIPWNKGKHGLQTAWNKGKNHLQKDKNPMWKGGITPLQNQIRSSIEMKLWIQSVFARDGYTCQKTGIKGGKLTAHHIQNFSSHPELRFAIDNGVTLSIESHKLFHQIYGIKNNTKEQLDEFLNI